MPDFQQLPEGPVTLENLHVPDHDGNLAVRTIAMDDGKIAASAVGPALNMGGAIALPLFTDMHTHLDKGHIWRRAPNPNGTFQGALETVAADRAANWTADDVRRRMTFALRCAYAHGTGAIRTHLDSLPPQDEISWPVFREVRQEWSDRIDLQASCLAGIDMIDLDGHFARTARIVADSGGILGTVAYPVDDLEQRLEAFFSLATKHGLSADFHADETGDPSAATLRAIAETVLRTGFDAPVVVGHCCSLAMQEESEADRTLDLVAEAGLKIVSLPLCNLYLQDRESGRTPRWRGITLVHEMRARGIDVSFASDNTRDPFYAYGDLDMVEVLREATRIAHLDHSSAAWIKSFNETPSRSCGFPIRRLEPDGPADMVIFRARSMNELMARPQGDRIVMRHGRAIDRTLPDYSELDDLMELT